eukprot:3875404-Prymnesium_polylepis.1
MGCLSRSSPSTKSTIRPRGASTHTSTCLPCSFSPLSLFERLNISLFQPFCPWSCQYWPAALRARLARPFRCDGTHPSPQHGLPVTRMRATTGWCAASSASAPTMPMAPFG